MKCPNSWINGYNSRVDEEPPAQPAPVPAAPPEEHIGWCRYVTGHEKATRIVLCDSDAPGAFKVYRAAETPAPVPLTDERIAELWVDILSDTPASGIHETEGLQWVRLARAIERAHGIAASPEQPK